MKTTTTTTIITNEKKMNSNSETVKMLVYFVAMYPMSSIFILLSAISLLPTHGVAQVGILSWECYKYKCFFAEIFLHRLYIGAGFVLLIFVRHDTV